MTTATTSLDPQEVVSIHPCLRFRAEQDSPFLRRTRGDRNILLGCILIDAYVHPGTVMRKARALGAIDQIGENVYYIVEFTSGVHQNTGSGRRSREQLEKMLREMRAAKFTSGMHQNAGMRRSCSKPTSQILEELRA